MRVELGELSMNFSSVVTPTLVFQMNSVLCCRATEQRLEETQRKLYIQILEPYITLFANLTPRFVEALETKKPILANLICLER